LIFWGLLILKLKNIKKFYLGYLSYKKKKIKKKKKKKEFPIMSTFFSSR